MNERRTVPLGKGLAELFLVLGRQVFEPVDIVGLVKVVLDVLELLRRDTSIVTPGKGRVAVCIRKGSCSKLVFLATSVTPAENGQCG